MPLVVNPIVYTSFPKVGFQSLASSSVPIEIQQAFLEQIVYQQWDTYNPPPSGYRAVYLYQVTTEQFLFGWLYNDGNDDLGRSNIPYFVAYYLFGRLSSSVLEQILNCLELGPPMVINRQNPPKQLENLIIPDTGNYEPSRRGLSIDAETRQTIHRNLQQKRVIRLFIGLKVPDTTTYLNVPLEELGLPPIPPNIALNSITPTTAKNDTYSNYPIISPIVELLESFVKKPIGIQGTALISGEGQLIVPPVGMDQETATLTAARMLYLAQSTQDELDWQTIDNVSIRGKTGHLILNRCDADVFLLVKTGKTLSGLLETEINRFVKQLQPALNSLDSLDDSKMLNGNINSETPNQGTVLPNLEIPEKDKEDDTDEYDPAMLYDDDDEISYRGRRLN